MPANMAYFGGYELGRSLIPGRSISSSQSASTARLAVAVASHYLTSFLHILLTVLCVLVIDIYHAFMLPAAEAGLVGDMAVGAVAQLTGGLLFTPIDIVKERMQASHVTYPIMCTMCIFTTNRVWLAWACIWVWV